MGRLSDGYFEGMDTFAIDEIAQDRAIFLLRRLPGVVVLEEILFRVLPYATFERRWAFWASVCACAFAHVISNGIGLKRRSALAVYAIFQFALAALLAWTYELGGFYWSTLVHYGWDTLLTLWVASVVERYGRPNVTRPVGQDSPKTKCLGCGCEIDYVFGSVPIIQLEPWGGASPIPRAACGPCVAESLASIQMVLENRAILNRQEDEKAITESIESLKQAGGPT